MFCTFCGKPEARIYPERPFPRCEEHSTAPAPVRSGGQDPVAVLERVRGASRGEILSLRLGDLEVGPDLDRIRVGDRELAVSSPQALAGRLGLPWAYYRGDAERSDGLREAMLRHQIRLHADIRLFLRLAERPSEVLWVLRSAASDVRSVGLPLGSAP